MEQCNGTYTPMETGQKLLPAQPSDILVDPREYQSLVGSLMYLAVGTWPDIAYSVAVLRKFNAQPTNNHFQAAKHLLRYLKQTASLALIYSPADSLVGYTNSDFAEDTGDRKSTSGYVFTLTNAAVSWRSKKQTLVSLSSTEAEYVRAQKQHGKQYGSAVFITKSLPRIPISTSQQFSYFSPTVEAPSVLLILHDSLIGQSISR